MLKLNNVQRLEDLSPLMRGLIAGKKLHHVQGTVSEVLSKGALAYAIHQYIYEWKVLPLEDSYTIPRMDLFLFWKEGDTSREQSEIIEIRKMIARLSREQWKRQLDAGRALWMTRDWIKLRTVGGV